MSDKALAALEKLVPAPSTKIYQFYQSHYELIRDEIVRLQSDLTAAKAENEALRARVAELEEFVSDTATACQRSLDPDWVPDLVHDALSPISDRCRTLLGDDPGEYESAWLLRKQAEAVEAAVSELMPGRCGAPDDPSPEFNAACEMCADFSDYAQRLRQKADDAERAGGGK